MIFLLAALLPALSSGPADTEGATRLSVPQVQYRINEASASRSPWIDANGWRIQRTPGARFYYDVPSKSAALAAAEAFAYRAHAAIHTDAAGQAAFHRMLEFLSGLPPADLPVLANIGFIDDGSDEAGELLNMLARRNLLFRIITAPDPHLDLNVRPGDKAYPKDQDPDLTAHQIRSDLTDEKRLVRLYGSEVVVARLDGDGNRVRVHLLNYAGRPVVGLRVRVLGAFPHAAFFASEKPDKKLLDFRAENGATEFTVPEMSTYAVVDLSK